MDGFTMIRKLRETSNENAVLFDEFGKYTEFATVRSQIAGSGVLQDLFEAIQVNANNVCFLGFIQFELNAYVQRVAPEYKNEIEVKGAVTVVCPTCRGSGLVEDDETTDGENAEKHHG